jgi:hypothetical protein
MDEGQGLAATLKLVVQVDAVDLCCGHDSSFPSLSRSPIVTVRAFAHISR